MAYLELLLPLAERMVLIWFFAYIFSQSALFWNILKSRVSLKDKVQFVAFFSIISILGTYLGIRLTGGAIANIRPVGAIVAGFIGGPTLGMTVGLISGLHRWSMGGFTAFACGVATIAEGLAGGVIGLKARRGYLDLKWAFVAGVVGEILQVGFVLLLAKPFEEALTVEKIVALPMIIVNTLGVLGFVLIVRDAFMKHNGMIISQFNRFVEIERQMFVAVEGGFNAGEAEAFIQDLTSRTELKGIFLLKDNQLLSFRGSEQEIKRVQECWIVSPQDKSLIIPIDTPKGGVRFYCAPVGKFGEGQSLTIGIKLQGKNYYDQYFIKFTDGLAELLNNQIQQHALSKLHDKMSMAQLKALKAQIQPHFLFNALSTISSYCRTDALKARELILDLAHYFRKNIEVETDFVTLDSELELMTAYLHIEKARLGERLEVEYRIPKDHLSLKIPTFLLQPIVENAIKYGIANTAENGVLTIESKRENGHLEILVQNTKGEKTEDVKGCGQALLNIKERITLLYGHRGYFELDCTHPTLTTARLILPQEV